MKTYSFKKILEPREAQPTLNAFSGNLGILVDNSNQKDDVDVLISRLNHGDASYVHESWQKLTGGFDLDKIERIINGIEDDAMLDAIVRIIKSEYLRLVKQGKIEAISRKKDYVSGRGICVYDACFEELINDFITHRKEIKEALQNEKEEREKAASFFSIFYNEEDRKKSVAPLSPNFLPSDKKLDGQTGRLWVENIAEKAISEERHATIVQLREEAGKLKQSNALLKKQIKKLKKRDAQMLKENKKHLQEIENLKKINSTQEETITQLRQDITDAIYTPQIEYEMTEEEKEAFVAHFDDAVYEEVFYDDNIKKIDELENKNKELEAKIQRIIEEQGQKYINIDVLIKGLGNLPDTKEKLSFIEKLGIYVLGDTPCAKRILSLAREINRNLKEIQARQGQTNISAAQLVMGNGTQNITNANMATKAE
ncbi:MAG: hypothetical protein ACTTKT_06835 [Prevotella veroralis]